MIDQYHQQLDEVMKRHVSRAEFLKFSGVAILGVIGVTGFLKNLHESVPGRLRKGVSTSHGYGRSAYGR